MFLATPCVFFFFFFSSLFLLFSLLSLSFFSLLFPSSRSFLRIGIRGAPAEDRFGHVGRLDLGVAC